MSKIKISPKIRLIRLEILILLILNLFLIHTATSQDSIKGFWKTIDDETGIPKSIVEIYQVSETYQGRIVELLPPEAPNKICTQCTGEKRNQPAKGLQIISNIKEIERGKTWGNGEILDPNNGKTYRCLLELKNLKTLEVRGYIGFSLFGRSQTWYRVE